MTRDASDDGAVQGHLTRLPPDASADASAMSGDADAMPRPDASSEPLLERGEYLVRHVSGCMECHTPRRRGGAFDESRLLSGVEELEDLAPADELVGALHSRNLTPDKETGLGEWSDEEIKNAFQHGMAPDGRVLHWTMPYWLYHDMTPQDADAVVAYLRSIPAVHHEVPEPQPLPVELTKAVHLPHGAIPNGGLSPDHRDYERAQRGRYLATAAGICPFCHTAGSSDPSMPIDIERVFMGRRELVPTPVGMKAPEDAPTIETRNLTPHATGLGEWSEQDVATALLRGISRSGLPVCDPMPSTYGASLQGMREQDARDIGVYLRSLRPRDSGEIEACCTACHGPGDGDAGVTVGTRNVKR